MADPNYVPNDTVSARASLAVLWWGSVMADLAGGRVGYPHVANPNHRHPRDALQDQRDRLRHLRRRWATQRAEEMGSASDPIAPGRVFVAGAEPVTHPSGRSTLRLGHGSHLRHRHLRIRPGRGGCRRPGALRSAANRGGALVATHPGAVRGQAREPHGRGIGAFRGDDRLDLVHERGHHPVPEQGRHAGEQDATRPDLGILRNTQAVGRSVRGWRRPVA